MGPADIAAVVDNNRGYGYGYPAMPYGGWGSGFGGLGGDWIIVFIAMMMFGGFGGGWGMGGGMGGFGIPWLMAGQQGINNNVNNGFDNAAVMGQLNGIMGAVNGGFASQEVANCNRAMDAMQTAYTNEIAGLNRSFAAQSAVDARLDSLAMALQQCCCDNRLATEGLKAVIAQENCADRYEAANNTRDIIENANRNNQAILDKLCQLELDGMKQNYENRIASLEGALSAAQAANVGLRGDAARVAQTRDIENYIRPQINPAYIVPNPYACNYGGGYNGGCGGNYGYGM